MATLRAALGGPAYEAAAATGRALSRAAATAEALEEAARLAREADDVVVPTGKLRSTTELEQLAEGLAPRELEVVGWITQSLTNREIAERMSISAKAVEKHVSNVLAKLDLANRREIAAWGRARRQ